jgi:hypothetical protein
MKYKNVSSKLLGTLEDSQSVIAVNVVWKPLEQVERSAVHMKQGLSSFTSGDHLGRWGL